MANGAFRPARRLRWHYRSRHSGLIKFSNRMVYDDNLVVFPSATEEQAHMGVALHVVNGLYKAGTKSDRGAADGGSRSAFMKDEPHRSLGVVTLNQKQKELVEQEMKFALEREPEARTLCRNLGGEKRRTRAVFHQEPRKRPGRRTRRHFHRHSLRPGAAGRAVMQRFGPINGAAGKRRLNVLFSRAKQRRDIHIDARRRYSGGARR